MIESIRDDRNDQDDDEYLWSRSGPIDGEVAELERELGSLGWQPRSAAPPVMVRPRSDRPRSRGRPALIAGLAMAAAVLSAIYLARPDPQAAHPPGQPPTVDSIPAIQPAGQPTHSEDLRDPFSASSHSSNSAAPAGGDLRDPFGGPPTRIHEPGTHSDLKDPFLGRPARPPVRPDPQPGDLKDPFANSASKSTTGDLLDPFARDSSESSPSKEPSTPSNVESSDLVDPFEHQPRESPG